jgi:hypothetical protein
MTTRASACAQPLCVFCLRSVPPSSAASSPTIALAVQVHDRIQFLQAIENAIEHEYGPS